MKIVFISDTHMGHRDISVPYGDILVHCGDATFRGELTEMLDFSSWLADLPHKHKIFVPGNHDFLFESDPGTAKSIFKPSCHCLINESIEIDGLKLWGSPYSLPFRNWAFMKKEEELSLVWDKIPNDTQILITHTPPYLWGDNGFGSKSLTQKLASSKNIKISASGHIHSGYGQRNFDGQTFINCSMMDEQYELKNAPIVVDTKNYL